MIDTVKIPILIAIKENMKTAIMSTITKLQVNKMRIKGLMTTKPIIKLRLSKTPATTKILTDVKMIKIANN